MDGLEEQERKRELTGMSVRTLAIEVYRAMKEVEELEKKLESLPSVSSARKDVEEELRQARAEHARLKAMLEGAKAD